MGVLSAAKRRRNNWIFKNFSLQKSLPFRALPVLLSHFNEMDRENGEDFVQSQIQILSRTLSVQEIRGFSTENSRLSSRMESHPQTPNKIGVEASNFNKNSRRARKGIGWYLGDEAINFIWE